MFKPDRSLKDSPIRFPIAQTAVGTDAVGPDFEMIKHDLNLKYKRFSGLSIVCRLWMSDMDQLMNVLDDQRLELIQYMSEP